LLDLVSRLQVLERPLIEAWPILNATKKQANMDKIEVAGKIVPRLHGDQEVAHAPPVSRQRRGHGDTAGAGSFIERMSDENKTSSNYLDESELKDVILGW
jgi:hypothetical protein